jgi:hypothetical protein
LSTCTDLISAINAVVVDPNLLASLDPSTIATLSTGNTTETAFSLGAGGPAVLSIPSSPSVDGKVFQLTIAGRIAAVSGSGGIGLYLGNSATLGSDQNLFGPTSDVSGITMSFVWKGLFIWDSVTQRLRGIAADTLSASGTGTSTTTGVASQSSLQFVLSGKFNGSSGSNSITITEFKTSLI